jgi:hypothetical protein
MVEWFYLVCGLKKATSKFEAAFGNIFVENYF